MQEEEGGEKKSEKKKHEMKKKTIATKSELQKPRRANDNRETGNMHM